MNKYTSLEQTVFDIFGSVSWGNEGIPTYPSNFINPDGLTEYIRVSIVASKESINNKSVAGQLIIDIFTAAGEGPKRASQIADILDSHLSSKSISSGGNCMQLQGSTLVAMGKDTTNLALDRKQYIIPFNYFGV